jgi:hypothetical protein
VVLAREYQWMQRHPDADRLERFDRWEPHVAAALRIWQDGASLRKPVIEAALLAKEPIDAVGRRFGLHGDTVLAYERLFFSVEEMLPHAGYIMAQAIGPKIHGPLIADDFPLLLKLYACNFGPGVLDALLGLYAAEIRPDRADELGLFSPAACDLFWLRASLAVMALDVTSRTAFDVLRLWLHFRQLERDRDRNGSLTDTLAENIEAVLAEYRLAFGIEPPAVAAA